MATSPQTRGEKGIEAVDLGRSWPHEGAWLADADRIESGNVEDETDWIKPDDPVAEIAHCDYADGRFEVSDKGVIYQPNADEDGTAKASTWICSPLLVIAKTRSAESATRGAAC